MLYVIITIIHVFSNHLPWGNIQRHLLHPSDLRVKPSQAFLTIYFLHNYTINKVSSYIVLPASSLLSLSTFLKILFSITYNICSSCSDAAKIPSLHSPLIQDSEPSRTLNLKCSPTIPNADTTLATPLLVDLWPTRVRLPTSIMVTRSRISSCVYSTLSSVSDKSYGSIRSILRTRNLVWVLLDPIR